MSEKKSWAYFIKSAIGIAIMAAFWFAPPVAPITELGMKVAGIFTGMVWLWSTIEALWPSILGIILLGIAGMGGDAGANGVWMNAVGNNSVLLVLFGFILFGAMDMCGDSLHMARWILTRKIFSHRPYVFLFLFFFTGYILGAFAGAIATLIIMWPIGIRVMEIVNVKREDKLWSFFFVGLFFFVSVGKTFFPFKGALVGPLTAFQTMCANSGLDLSIPYVPFMLNSLVLTTILLVIYLFALKLLKVDMATLKIIEPKMIDEQMNLPKMNFVQKAYMIMVPIWLALMILPSVLPPSPFATFLNGLGPLGCTAAVVLFMVAFHHEGKTLLNFKEVAYKNMNWGIFFMIAAAIYTATSLSKPATGISQWLVVVLNPIFGGQPEMVFVFLMLLIALIITNFANNAAMAMVLMPVIIQFSIQMGIDPTPLAICVIQLVFVAMLTPSASPQSSMMWGKKEMYEPKEILTIGIPLSIASVLVFTFIGYPLCKFLLAAFGG